MGAVGNVLDTFRYHIATGSLTQVSVGSNGAGNDDSFNARPTGNGGLVAMASDASNFDPLDTNSLSDVFLVVPGGGDGGGGDRVSQTGTRAACDRAGSVRTGSCGSGYRA